MPDTAVSARTEAKIEVFTVLLLIERLAGTSAPFNAIGSG
jgi:hypothetical protein